MAWPLFRIHSYGVRDPDLGTHSAKTETFGPEWSQLRQHCSAEMPELVPHKTTSGFSLLVPAGPVGNTAAIDCLFGCSIESLGNVHRDPEEAYGELFSLISIPVEVCAFDLLFHRDMAPPE